MKILLASPIDSEAIEELAKRHQVICGFREREERLQTLIRDCEILVFRSGVKITAQLMDCAPGLRLLLRAGSGLDNLDLEYACRRGLELVRIQQPGAQAVAEMAFAFMLALSRRLLEADRSMRQARWSKHELTGYLLKGKTLGILGVGSIGERVAEMGLAWGMEVIGCVEHPCPKRALRFRDKGIQLLGFGQVISGADYVTIHVPLTDSTRNLVNADALACMQPGSYLVNLARGGVVDEQALCRELTNGGRLRGAALDVHEEEGEGKLSPLAGLPNVILTPHIGAMAADAQREIGRQVIDIVDSHAGSHSRVLLERVGSR